MAMLNNQMVIYSRGSRPIAFLCNSNLSGHANIGTFQHFLVSLHPFNILKNGSGGGT